MMVKRWIYIIHILFYHLRFLVNLYRDITAGVVSDNRKIWTDCEIMFKFFNDCLSRT